MDYGTVQHNEVALTITQQPYINDNVQMIASYTATAESDDGDCYIVVWPITNADAADESDACDWNTYTIYNA